MSDKVLISFASESFYNAQNLLATSAKGSGITKVINYTNHTLPEEFKENNKTILDHARGYGYWVWKPYILLKTFDLINDGDIVIYADACNRIIHNLGYVFDKCEEKDIVLFDNRDGNYNHECWRNVEWTKKDCFSLMGCDDEKYWNGKQVNASYQVYKKNEKTTKFLEEYLSYCLNYSIITDAPNITGDNDPRFRDHRHDQSVLSLLAIKHNIELLIDPSEWGNFDVNRPYPQLFWHCRGHL